MTPLKKLLFAILASVITQAAYAQDSAYLQANKQYDAAFSYYVEACGATKYQPIGEENGSHYGHGLLYIRGACRDTGRTDFPHIKVCGPEAGPDAGVGISLDRYFKNVEWTAVDGRDFLFYGGLAPDQPLTTADRDAMIDRAAAAGYFKGVTLQSYEDGVNPGESYEHFVARESFGTEYGIGLARSLYCTKIPIEGGLGKSKDIVLQQLVDYLNALNESVHKTGLKYDLISNNCSHLVHNALAAIGFWAPKKTSWKADTALEQLKGLKDIAVPMNEMFDALRVGNGQGRPLDDVDVLSDPAVMKTLAQAGWMAAEPGVIVQNIPIHAYENKLFNTRTKAELFDIVDEILIDLHSPIEPDFEGHAFRRYLAKSNFTDLKANLRSWLARYQPILQEVDDSTYRPYLVEKAVFIQRLLDENP